MLVALCASQFSSNTTTGLEGHQNGGTNKSIPPLPLFSLPSMFLSLRLGGCLYSPLPLEFTLLKGCTDIFLHIFINGVVLGQLLSSLLFRQGHFQYWVIQFPTPPVLPISTPLKPGWFNRLNIIPLSIHLYSTGPGEGLGGWWQC